MSLVCWLCVEFGGCPYPVCYEQEEIQKRLEQEWDGEKALTQKEVTKLIQGFNNDRKS